MSAIITLLTLEDGSVAVLQKDTRILTVLEC